MNELGNIGFTYDIKTFTPDGEKKDDFSVHNLITDEGLRWVVARIFAKDTVAPAFTKNYKYNAMNSFNLSFMTKSHTPNSTFDSFPTFIAEVGEVELKDKLKCAALNRDGIHEDYYYNNERCPMKVKSINVATNTLTFHSRDHSDNLYFRCKNSPVILTGVFFTAYYNWYVNCSYGTTSEATILLSEAMFPEPILLEVDGKLQVNCGCTVISA